ncbi:MAG TPA: glycosyltransferase [Solirubrobacterales bacterium]
MPDPRFSILAPVSDPPRSMLDEMLASVQGQDFADWELCLCADGATRPQIREALDTAAARDSRVRVRYCDAGGMAAAEAEALRMAGGSFVALLGDRDRLHREALVSVDRALQLTPEADFVYTDEDEIDAEGRRSGAFFKPDWSPERLRVEMYTGRLSFLRRSLLEEVGGYDPALGDAAEWDLVLRVTEQARAVLHVPRVLCDRHVIELDGDVVEGGGGSGAARVRAVQAHCERIGLPARAEPDPSRPGGCRLRPELTEAPTVSIVIPTCGQSREIRGKATVLVLYCMRSILATSTYDRYEVVCVADTSTDTSTLEELRVLGGERLRVVPYDQPFNFSAKINLGAAHSDGEHLLFLNDDMEVLTPDWIERMIMYSSQAGIGAVGAQLRWEDERVQHAGVVLERGLPGHVYRGAGGELSGYARNVLVTQNYLAVTGACLMTPRDAFERVGGFPAELPVNYNDIYYCLALRDHGLRVVYDADTVLYHFESSSRDTKVNDWEKSMLRERWQSVIGEDPYSNPNLRYGEPRPGLLRRGARFARARLSR